MSASHVIVMAPGQTYAAGSGYRSIQRDPNGGSARTAGRSTRTAARPRRCGNAPGSWARAPGYALPLLDRGERRGQRASGRPAGSSRRTSGSVRLTIASSGRSGAVPCDIGHLKPAFHKVPATIRMRLRQNSPRDIIGLSIGAQFRPAFSRPGLLQPALAAWSAVRHARSKAVEPITKILMASSR